ncbi:MAG: tRNA threonylcarbamoyladenosine dehydratase [Bacteroidales bacterium]|nr:tRNA threonylcarbamoyladenosine dehydratase [Bacteroidales bacterium]
MDKTWRERTILQVGEEGAELLARSRVAVIGLGGVGAFAAEMIVRAGVGEIIIADSDVYNITNKNRQLGALDSTIGKKKTDVMRERLGDINKELKITVIDEYLTEENMRSVLPFWDKEGKVCVDFVVDAIDTLSPKIALISLCMSEKIPLVSSMGAGAKYDATKVRLTDISKSFNCPLAYMLRKRLRKVGIHKGFQVVFSEELPIKEAIIPFEEQNKKSRTGTISYLPAVFGSVCAQAAVKSILTLDL